LVLVPYQGGRKVKQTRITTVEQVIECAGKRQSLICPSLYGEGKPIAAAFAQNFIGRSLASLFKRGLFVYVPFSGGIGAKFGKRKRKARDFYCQCGTTCHHYDVCATTPKATRPCGRANPKLGDEEVAK
jgi:hypothetical protein